MKLSIKNVLYFVLLLGIAFYFYSSPKNKEGTTAPDFSTELVDGTAFSLSDLRGSYVLLDFWGSWCPPCRRDNPDLVALYNNYHGQEYKDASDFEVVTVALEKDDKRWQRAAEKDGFLWKYQIVRIAKLVLTDPLALKYQVKDVPSKFLIDPDGQVVGVNLKREEIEAYLDARKK